MKNNKLYIRNRNNNEFAVLDITTENTWYNTQVLKDYFYIDVDNPGTDDELTWAEFKHRYNIEMSEILDAIPEHPRRY